MLIFTKGFWKTREGVFGALKILFYFKDILMISGCNHILRDVTRKSSRKVHLQF